MFAVSALGNRSNFCAVGFGWMVYLCLLLLSGCNSFSPTHEVWLRVADPNNDLQKVAEIMERHGMQISSYVGQGEPELGAVYGRVVFVRGFRWARDPTVLGSIRRRIDGQLLQVRIDDLGKDGPVWRPDVLQLARDIEDDLRNEFSSERILIPSDLLRP